MRVHGDVFGVFLSDAARQSYSRFEVVARVGRFFFGFVDCVGIGDVGDWALVGIVRRREGGLGGVVLTWDLGFSSAVGAIRGFETGRIARFT